MLLTTTGADVTVTAGGPFGAAAREPDGKRVRIAAATATATIIAAINQTRWARVIGAPLGDSRAMRNFVM